MRNQSNLNEQKRFGTNLMERVARSSDASFFQIIPSAVFYPKNEEDIIFLFREAKRKNLPVTFRAGGTSLSGQAVGAGVIADISRGWREFVISDDGKKMTLQPGVILDHANLFLKSRKRRLGPDPASGKACMIGGIIGNNASGITSGTLLNSYKTVDAIRFVLPGGTIIDTSDPDADLVLREKEPKIYAEINAIKDEIRADKESVERIRYLYTMKNTVGYSVNAFLDYDSPAEILGRLMIGSEGTLGFVSSVTYNTVPDLPFKATVLLGFKDLESAAAKVLELREAGAAAIEILNFHSIMAIRDNPGMPALINEIPEGGAALLTEFHSDDGEELKKKIDSLGSILDSVEMKTPFVFDEEERTALWKARKELFASAAGHRPAGTTEITEDVVVPPHKLSETLTGIETLLRETGFGDAFIFGHARDGSFHFNFSADFSKAGVKKNFWEFSEKLARLICVDMNGALKGEHGTGRAIAPFLEMQWGKKITGWMKRIKKVIDPNNILNPEVIFLSGDPLELPLKILPKTDPEIDLCVECGFCEPKCPSRDLTLSPRQRIVVSRFLRKESEGKNLSREAGKVRDDFDYGGIETCAVDGLCETACPININTGVYIKKLRSDKITSFGEKTALWVQEHFDAVTKILRASLAFMGGVRKITGDSSLQKISFALNRLSRRVPVWNKYLPVSAKVEALYTNADIPTPDWVYFPSCVSRTMGNFPGEKKISQIEAVTELAKHAGVTLKIPPQSGGFCCGLAFSSKGFKEAARKAAEKTVRFLYEESDAGDKKILMDTSPCTQFMKNYDSILSGEILEMWKKLNIFDIVEFVHDFVLPKIEIKPVKTKITFHPVCSVKKMGLEEKLKSILERCGEEVYVPPITGCCASAGDRGLHYPELSASATAVESSYLKKSGAVKYYSSSRTCEIGMSNAVGRPFESVVYLVLDAIESKNGTG